MRNIWSSPALLLAALAWLNTFGFLWLAVLDGLTGLRTGVLIFSFIIAIGASAVGSPKR